MKQDDSASLVTPQQYRHDLLSNIAHFLSYFIIRINLLYYPCFHFHAGYLQFHTNHVYRVYSVAAVLYLQFVLLVMLFHPRNTNK